jgi:hypothetical protein
MFRRVLVLIFVIIVVVALFYAYKKYVVTDRMDNGAVHCVGCLTPSQEAAFKRENAGEGVDGQSEHKYDWSGTEQDRHRGETVTYDPSARPPDRPTPEPAYDGAVRQAPEQDVNALNQRRFVDPNRGPGRYDGGYDQRPYPGAGYGGDTLQPNAPNGMAFGGRGVYQWYREGNLTWRLNTETGASCVAYATMDEWRKPLVLRNGCGGRG